MKEYALYKGDTLLAVGTVKEIAYMLKIKVDTVYFYGTPTWLKRTSEKARRLIEIEE